MVSHDSPKPAVILDLNEVSRVLLREGGVSVVSELGAMEAQRHFPNIRKELSANSAELIVFDPASADTRQRTLESALRSLIESAAATGADLKPAVRLLEVLEGQTGFSAKKTAGRLRQDTLGRIWSEVTESFPAVLVVLNPRHATQTEIEELQYLGRFVFADPIQGLAPETPQEVGFGGMLIIDDGTEFDFKDASVRRIDATIWTQIEVLELLSSPDVVRKFASAMGGDVSRIRALVDDLPNQSRSLQLYQYQQLQVREQAILEVLAVAGEPIPVEGLKQTTSLLQASEYFARTLRVLSDQNLIRKVVGRSSVQVALQDTEFEAVLLDALDTPRRREIHLALAGAQIVNDAQSVVFIASHLMRGGDLESASVYGAKAAQRLFADRSYDAARDFVREMLTSGVHVPLEIKLLLGRSLEVCGDSLEAIELFAEIEPELESAAARAELNVQIGEIALKLGQFEEATLRFDSALALSDLPSVERARALGLGEARYAMGQHEDLIAEIGELILTLAEEHATGKADPDVDSCLLRARNILGKTLIFRAEYSQAEELFRSNRLLAHNWGWDEEVARAQANLGVVALQRCDYSEALTRLQGALDSSGLRGSLPKAYCLVNLATVRQQRNEFEAALKASLGALRASKKAGDSVAYSVAAHNLATIYQDMGAFDRAHEMLAHLEGRLEPQEQTLTSRWNRLVLGYLHLDEGAYALAIAVFEELTAGQDVSKLLYGKEAVLRLAQANLALGQVDSAKQVLSRTLAADGDARKLKLIRELVEAQLSLAEGDFESALVAVDVGQQLASLGSKLDPVQGYLTAARALRGLGRDGESRAQAEEGLQWIGELAKHIPLGMEDGFYKKPLHIEMVALVQELSGAVPDAFSLKPISIDPVTPISRSSEWQSNYGDIVGEDPKLLRMFHVMDRVAPSHATVLIYGESGTGKELISEAIHHNSGRAQKPFVKVNCAAFVENLLLSELFGHEKGAFTGATSQKQGRFELADGGTIFLDEIGDISPNTQVALLRVLQDGRFERVGGSQTLDVDVRVVAATNRDLEAMVERGEFRLDLYYRLKGIVLESPALRDRRQDIPRLIRHFAEMFAEHAPKEFSAEAMQYLVNYNWPGNIRELQNFVRSIVLFVEGDRVEFAHLTDFGEFFAAGTFTDVQDIQLDQRCDCPTCGQAAPTSVTAAPVVSLGTASLSASAAESALVDSIVSGGLSLNDLKRRLEHEAIRRALAESNGNVTKAAEMLQMKRPRLSQIINASEDLTQLKSELVG